MPAESSILWQRVRIAPTRHIFPVTGGAAAGLPRIGTNVGGIPESMLHGEDGLIVPLHDAAALAEAIATLVRDPALARRYGEAARERLRAEFNVAGFLDKVTVVCDELAASAPPSCITRAWMAICSTWFQLTSRAYAGLTSDLSAR